MGQALRLITARPLIRARSTALGRLLVGGLLAALSLSIATAAWADDRPELSLAGFAYLGSAAQIEERFRYSRRYELAQKALNRSIYDRLQANLQDAPPQHFRMSPRIDSLRGRDSALTAALLISNETVAIEKFGALTKLAVIIRGQTMVFDFKSLNVVRSYPLSFAYVDLFDRDPSEAEIDARVKLVFEGANGKPGLTARFVQSLATAAPLTATSRYLGITRVDIKPEAGQGLPSFVRAVPADARSWAADLVAEAISTRLGVPLVPYSNEQPVGSGPKEPTVGSTGYAIGAVMAMSVSDGTVFNLNLPKPDYEIAVSLTGFRKIKFAEITGGATSYVYGAYADLQITEPLSGRQYFSTSLKNGETRVIPASQQYVEDGPHFYDAVNGLFVKTALAMNESGDPKWLQSAASAKDISAQLVQVKELMKLCRQ